MAGLAELKLSLSQGMVKVESFRGRVSLGFLGLVQVRTGQRI